MATPLDPHRPSQSTHGSQCHYQPIATSSSPTKPRTRANVPLNSNQSHQRANRLLGTEHHHQALRPNMHRTPPTRPHEPQCADHKAADWAAHGRADGYRRGPVPPFQFPWENRKSNGSGRVRGPVDNAEQRNAYRTTPSQTVIRFYSRMRARGRHSQRRQRRREHVPPGQWSASKSLHRTMISAWVAERLSPSRECEIFHIHVTKDVNEIISYLPWTMVAHIRNNAGLMKVRESELEFCCHLAGFVYKVSYEDKNYIKKEVSDSYDVHEFLYEANALNALNGSDHIIRLETLMIDDSRTTVKSLLIEFAQRDALVNLLYDHKGKIP